MSLEEHVRYYVFYILSINVSAEKTIYFLQMASGIMMYASLPFFLSLISKECSQPEQKKLFSNFMIVVSQLLEASEMSWICLHVWLRLNS